MKKLELVMALLMVSGLAFAHDGFGPGGGHGGGGHGGGNGGGRGGAALQYAEDVERALVDLSTDLQREGDRLNQSGQLAAVSDYDRASDVAMQVSRLLHREVTRDLQVGQDGNAVADRLRRLEREFRGLRDSVSRLGQLAPHLQVSLKRIFDSLEELNRNLFDAPLTAACNIKTGGNFFKPKSHIECTVFGRGATGYEATVSGPQGSSSVHGVLSPGQSSFFTEKVEVGYNPHFEMYLITRNGQRVLVSSN